ncbi:MAG: SDR family oxidoreductase, partial [candidate division Zixibacteria bacterium]|nr:SDR family oxidoreductase [candidate division Zixibacteria bacterium]
MPFVLVLGATGYVGGRLVPRLLGHGHRVRCFARDPRKLAGRSWASRVEIIPGDLLQLETLGPAMKDIDCIYYLVHSMASGEKVFENLDRAAASNVAVAAAQSRVRQIVYLGGLGKRGTEQSPHLRSRQEVGNVLRSTGVPVTELRAAVIVGSGSLSFEMIHHLTNRLPVMICPRWVYTRTQPIAIQDVLRYLIESLDNDQAAGKVFDIGGPEVLTYRDMMLTIARVLGLKRWLIPVPVLTPRLSSYWVNLVTPITAGLARPLIEGLRHETVCENRIARDVFGFEPITFEHAVQQALAGASGTSVESSWTDASPLAEQPSIDPSHLIIDRREILVAAGANQVFAVISSLGGDNGWPYADWLWALRGFIDKQLGGIGLRRGRRHPHAIAVGDPLDFWRV